MRIFTVEYKSKIRVMRPKMIQNDILGITIPQLRAVDENLLINFIAPQNCRRIVIRADKFSTPEDIETYLYNSQVCANVVTDMEYAAEFMNSESDLSIYEMNPDDFQPIPDVEGFFYSSSPCPTVKEYHVESIYEELHKRKAAVTFVSDLSGYMDHLKSSTMAFNAYRINYSESGREFAAPGLRAF